VVVLLLLHRTLSSQSFPWYQNALRNAYPNDLSFCIADLKFDGEKIKICELGQAFGSTFKGYNKIYGQGQMWAKFWQLMSSLNYPLWLFGSSYLKKEFAPAIFEKVGGHTARTLNELKPSSPKFILIVREKNDAFRTIKQHYPECIILDAATKKFVSNKYETGRLFEDQNIASYKPQFTLVPKNYAPQLAYEIIQKISSPLLVVKPINASLGRGIVIVEPEKLDAILRIVLKQKPTSTYQQDTQSLSYWTSDREKFFIVEEFVASKIIYTDNKPYDPTMRVAFVLFNNEGSLQINFLDAYWKLPSQALNENGSITQLHKSHIESDKQCSTPVDAHDFEVVKEQLSLLLSSLYLKMLAQYEHKKERI
jgi:hypothetical protein